ncbi:MAG TPA: poly-gamma-glutamate biosynthesis protein PgsC [Candidatus Aminicenantes bacterium]|nr:poly-gamma-glutamate biosynthesis protein PgsC [Candidatus Aminicenantes bacterium]
MLVLTIVVGLLLALLFSEAFRLYPGGFIVPVYFAYYLDQPAKLVLTLAAAGLSVLGYHLLERRLILFGRRRFVLILLLGLFWSVLFFLALPQFFPGEASLRTIGWIIPGILANNLLKQKLWPTLAGLTIVATLTFAIVQVVFLVK